MKIKAAVLNGPQQAFEVRELELDPPKDGEVLVRLAACGVCHSDWNLVTGDTRHPFPVVAGHEGAGIVEAVGAGVDPADLKAGDHVILNWAPSCGRCFYCLHDRPNLCETYTAAIWAGTMLDGTTRLHDPSRGGAPVYSYCGTAAFATHTVVPRPSCVKIRDELRDEVPLASACLVGCAVATGAGAAMFTARVRPGESVVVFGCGGVGLNAIQGARLCGASPIIAVDSRPEKIWVAKHFGAHGVLMHTDDLVRAVRAHTHGRGADHVIDALGQPAAQERALDLVRPGGTLTLAGLAPMGSTTSFPSAVLTRHEKTIKGSYYGSTNAARDFPLLLDLYAAGQLNLDDLITRRYGLEQINDAYRDMNEGLLARGVIVM